MNKRFEPLPVKRLPAAVVALIAFSGVIVVDMLPVLLLAVAYSTLANVVSR
ncbi:MAG: hypothetical protein MK110_19520 [Fuerstiella sp.]|nr:hypothetical protein [Fuerstiella sp.]